MNPKFKIGDRVTVCDTNVNAVTVLKNGNVGVGNSNPITTLAVEGSAIFGNTLNNEASGVRSAAFGWGTTASAPDSTAFGFQTIAGGVNSIAVGFNTLASGDHSGAFGAYTTASGPISAAFGFSTTAQPYGSFVVGRCNEVSGSNSWIDTDPLFVIGNGDQSAGICTNNINAVTILKNGNVGIGESFPQQPLVVTGIINSTSGGYVFPDGSTQTSAAPWITIPGGEIYFDGANVGIGNTNPNSDLDLTGVGDAFIQLDTRPGAPDPLDCTASDLGRMIVDNTLPYLYVCQMAGNPAAPTWIAH